MMPVAPASPSLQPWSTRKSLGLVGQRDRAERAGQQRGGGDADLDGGEEPVRVGDQLGDGRAAAAGLGQRADLALAQRDQRDLGGDEDALDDDQQQDDADVEQRRRRPRRSSLRLS